jgi:hypothetical protein
MRRLWSLSSVVVVIAAICVLDAAARPVGTSCLARGAQAVRLLAGGRHFSGEVLGHGRVAVAYAHDADSSFCTWQPAALYLARHGFRVLLFDYPVDPFLSESRNYPRGTFRFDRDLVAAAAYLRAHGAMRVVLGGDGIGGIGALAAARTLDRSVSAVFTFTAGGITGRTDTLGNSSLADDLHGLRVVKHLRTPAFFLGAPSDRNVRALYRTCASKVKRWQRLPAAAFAFDGFGLATWTANTPATRRIRIALVDFLRRRTR